MENTIRLQVRPKNTTAVYEVKVPITAEGYGLFITKTTSVMTVDQAINGTFTLENEWQIVTSAGLAVAQYIPRLKDAKALLDALGALMGDWANYANLTDEKKDELRPLWRQAKRNYGAY